MILFIIIKDDCVRPTDPEYAPGGQAAFSDGFAFLLASHKSLDALNSRILKPVSMENFRPNIVADSFGPYAEDNWDSIVFESSPSIPMKIVKPCARCKIPTIDPLTGIFDPNNEPTRTIKKFRSGKALGFRNQAWNGEVCYYLEDVSCNCNLYMFLYRQSMQLLANMFALSYRTCMCDDMTSNGKASA